MMLSAKYTLPQKTFFSNSGILIFLFQLFWLTNAVEAVNQETIDRTKKL